MPWEWTRWPQAEYRPGRGKAQDGDRGGLKRSVGKSVTAAKETKIQTPLPKTPCKSYFLSINVFKYIKQAVKYELMNSFIYLSYIQLEKNLKKKSMQVH